MFYLFVFFFLITGHIYQILLFTILILVHELGHTLTAYFFHWKIESICIYPYGGISKFSHYVNTANYQEFLVNVMGPITQIVFFLFFSFLLSDKYLELFCFYHYFLLIFNLLPIYPLDGGKLMVILFSYFTSFKHSYLFTFILSFLGIGILLAFSIVRHSILFFIILLFLFMKVRESNLNLNYLFHKFLLERYLYNFTFKKSIFVLNVDSFKKEKHHIVNGIEERKFLKGIFNSSKI